jgi:hypothetical protein
MVGIFFHAKDIIVAQAILYGKGLEIDAVETGDSPASGAHPQITPAIL